MRITPKIKHALSSPLASIIILLCSIAGRVLQKIHFTDTGGDKIAQIEATSNLLAGYGISVKEVFSTDLSQVNYLPLIKWPPGYSLLLSPFYKLSDDQFFWGSLWLDIIACILFVWFARKILLLFALPAYAINLYLLVTGFFIYSFAMYTSTDLMAHVFFEIALYLSLRFILQKKTGYANAFVIVLMLFMGGLMRYLFIPATIIIPSYLIVYGLVNRDKLFVSRGVFMLLALLLMITGLLVYQQSAGGAATYVIPTEKGFFPENLPRMNPFIFASFVNLEAFAVQAEKYTYISFLTIGHVLQLTNFFLFIALVLFFTAWFWKRKLLRPTPIEHFIYINTFCSFAIIGVLCFLSVTNMPVVTIRSVDWSFVDEGRYYSIPVFYIQQLVFLLVFLHRGSIKRWVFRALFFLLIVLFINTFHGAYYTTKKTASYPEGFYKKQGSFDMLKVYQSLLKKTVSENPGHSVVVCSDNPYMNNYAVLWEGVPGLEDFEKLNSSELASRKGTILFVTLHSRNNYRLTTFLANPSKKLVGQILNYSFYTLYVAPSGTP